MFGDFHGAASQRLGQVYGVLVPRTEYLPVEFLGRLFQHAAYAHDQLVPGAVAQVVIDVLEVIDIDE